MLTDPLITVVIPTYNSAKYVAETLDSVFNQTYKNIEVIVVDDNSTDSTPEVVKNYDCKYMQRLDNRGAAAARNVGSNNANGEYIAFLDSDDIWFADKLCEQMEVFRNYPKLALVTTDAEEYVDGSSTGRTLLRGRRLVTNFSEMVKQNLIVTSSVVARSDILKKMGGFEESLQTHEDYVLWLKIVHDYPYYIINKPLLYYRIHSESLSNISSSVDYEREVVVMTIIQSSINLSISEKILVWVKKTRKYLAWMFDTFGLIKYYNHVDRLIGKIY